MLPRAARLTQRRDFQRVYRRGRSITGPLLWLKYVESTTPSLRIGVVVSTKTAALATDRNRLKRQIRAILRDILQDPALTSGAKYDIVLSATPRARKADFDALKNALLSLFTKISANSARRER